MSLLILCNASSDLDREEAVTVLDSASDNYARTNPEASKCRTPTDEKKSGRRFAKLRNRSFSWKVSADLERRTDLLHHIP